YSIGTVTIDPKNPSLMWVGTGENNSQRSVSYGDGVYKSEDGGRTWRNMGLRKSEHIARILIDPRDSNVVYVAAPGPLWKGGGERGLYKTTDAGKTWTSLIKTGDFTGVADIIMDPRNPDILLAATHQRQRRYYTLIHRGPESAVWRSTDAGYVMNVNIMVSSDGGRTLASLPTRNKHVDNHEIWIDPHNNSRYLVACDGGVYETFDKGENWIFKANLPLPQFYDVAVDED